MRNLIFLALAGCTIESELNAERDEPTDPFDTGVPVTPPVDTDTAGLDTAETDEPGSSDDTGSTPDTDTGGTDTDVPDTDVPDTDIPDTDIPDTGEPDTGEPPTGTPPPSIPCPTDVLDPSMCGVGVAAWNTVTYATYATVQDGIDDASSGDTVAVCPGTWSENLAVPSTRLALRGYGEATTAIDAGGAGTVVQVGGGATFTLQDIALLNGSNGGLQASSADLLTCGVRFEGNASYDGGGLALGNGTWTGEDVSFVSNVAEYSGGGASTGTVTTTLVNATFTTNESRYDGGGWHVASEGTTSVWDSTFVDNFADYGGGGIKTNGWATGGDITLTRVTFTSNASGYEGGGIGSEGWSLIRFVLESCTFDSNVAYYEGGAVDLSSWGGNDVVDVGSTYTANRSTSGGAYLLGGWGPVTVDLTDVIVDGNFADSGAAFDLGNRGTATLIVTGGAVTRNMASSRGGGLSLDSDALVTVTTSDWGTGATDNVPDDGGGYVAGTSATFSCAAGVCF